MNATMLLESLKHSPVMLNQILSIISPQHGGTYIDCTFGGGGYSKAILDYPNTKVIAIDRDGRVKRHAEEMEKKFPNRFNFIQNKFSNLEKIIKPNTNPKAIIFDLGLSSLQIKDYSRGFSFNSRSKLDMQMGINEFSAFDAVNKLEKESLVNIIKFLGEEKFSKKIVNEIIKVRSDRSISNTKELADIIKKTKSRMHKHNKNPSTKTFQALRIFVNQELTELLKGLIASSKILQKGGILILVSFHSLEDTIVKSFFKLYSNSNANLSRYIPQMENKKQKTLFNMVEKKFLKPDEKEISKNPNSRSAKLRYGIRNDVNFFYPLEIKEKFEKYLKIESLTL